MTQDWIDFLFSLLDARARFMVAGAHAMAIHGVPRATQDIDIWIDRSPSNVKAVIAALDAFGASMESLGLSATDFEQPATVIQIGVAPNRIDILTSIGGVDEFDAAWSHRGDHMLRGRLVPFIGRDELLASKRAAGRQKDLGDLEMLGEE